MTYNEQLLRQLIGEYTSRVIISISKLPQSGSNRIYFRILLENQHTLIGVYNSDIRENKAFFYLSNLFLKNEVAVPKVLYISENQQYYLLNDLGDESLYSWLVNHREGKMMGEEVLPYYRKVLQALPRIQLAGKKIDFSVCYPRDAFDRQSMQWDLNYFKYYFLKLANIHFDEQLLENDFNTFMDFLLEADDDFFLYRDFQSRNIMLYDENPYFIDYQGGRKGALQYDVASLLYDGKADIAPEERNQLLKIYLEEASNVFPFDEAKFLRYFDGFVLIRIMQAMGTYGFRGYYEKKSHFLLSIPYAVRNIRYLLETMSLPIDIPELIRVLRAITESKELPQLQDQRSGLTVTVTSFSYKKGIPTDLTANGGGFVFDCRALPNPGREAQYRELDGRDQPVINYLEQHTETEDFKTNIFALIDASIENYLERNFSNLMVNFGCTGGQHRSVYFAESAAKHLAEKYPEVNVVLRHTNR
ncbi:phosphotransferase [Bacteroidales bacterium OttesenSCG-928-C03]|nr:phosphotransferase [Bacteroidales bacterium OttesenSCG-928-C03]MDL2325486.1 phosphotransferase [Bacteroidales bacterium OttesenSCG-928-A14]